LKWLIFAVLGIVITSFWPEFTLVILGGGPGRSYFLWPMLGMPFSGKLFVGFVILLWTVASLILVRRGIFHFSRPTPNWPLTFVGVISIWTLLYTGFDYTWLGRSDILDNYVILALLRTLLMWYLVFSQSADVVRSGKRLLWALLLVNVGGLVVKVLMSAGSLSPLFDPYSGFWEITHHTQVSLERLSPISYANEILAPAAIAGFAFLFSSTIHRAFRIALMGLIIMLAILIVGTGTRQAVIGMSVAVIIMVFMEVRRWPYRSTLMLSVVAILVFLGVVTYGHKFATVSSQRYAELPSIAENWKSFSRTLDFQRDINAFLKNPLIGNGLGFGSVNSTMRARDLLASHNLLASIAAEVGIIPLLATIGFLLAVIRSIRRLGRLQGQPAEHRVVLHGLVGLFVFDLMTSMVVGSGRMEGGYPFFGAGVALYFMAKSFINERSQGGSLITH
jgi:hypothetical protein